MANDPERDVLPVKDNDEKYSASSFRSSNRRDFSQSTSGNYMAKLDRNELENRYLRFVEENMTLKKHCHNQEEKIRRLAAKLLRLVAEQRSSQNKGSCTPKYSDLEVEEFISRVNELERSNQLLRDKLMVAGIQLSTHNPPRITYKSPQRFGIRPSSTSDFSRVPTSAPSNRPVTSDTDAEIADQSSVPASSCQFLEQEISKLRNQLLNYEKELETVREQSNVRVQALEDELTHVQEEGSRMAAALTAASAVAHTSARNLEQTSRRVAENVEIIKLNRNIKAQEEQLQSLEAERRKAFNDAQLMNSKLLTLQKENFDLNECLLNERKKNLELQNEVQKLFADSLTLQDLQEELKDLQKEKSILQDTNDKLIQSIMEEGFKIEDSNIEVTKKQSDNGEELGRKQPVVKQKEENTSKIEEDINRKEREIEKRVKELEEELKIKVEKEREAQIEKEKEKQNERARKLKEEELENQRILEASEREKLKEQVNFLEVLLKTKELNADKQEEELKALNSLVKELQSNNSKLTERLSAKNSEVTELLQMQKKLTEVTKIDFATQYEEEKEENEQLSSIPNTTESNNVTSDITKENCLLLSNLTNGNVDNCEQELVEKDDIDNGEAIDESEWEQKFYEVTRNLEKAEKDLQEQIEINSEREKEVTKLENELESAHARIDELVSEVNDSKSKTVDDSTLKKGQDPIFLGLNKNLDKGMCAFDLYLDEILLSEEGRAVLTKMVGEASTMGIFLTWNFYEQEAAYTPIFEGPDAHIDCLYSANIPIKDGFFEYLNKESLIIELHVAIEDISVPVAYSEISLKNCLNYPKTKLHNSITLISCANKMNDNDQEKIERKESFPECGFGILQCQFGLNCTKTSILAYQEAFSKKLEKIGDSDERLGISIDDEDVINEEHKMVEEDLFSDISEEQNIADENDLTEENLEIPPKPAPRNLKPCNEEEVDINVEQPPQIVIEIHSFQLLPESSVANDPNIHQLFIEYTFLGKQGESMETPVSLPKPQSDEKLCFNFRKVFPMDPIKNAMERNILQNMIHMRGSKRHKASLLAEGKVHFNVVSEPLEDEDSDAECLDVGYAEISIPQILLDGADIVEKDINVINLDGSEEVIGYLKISFLAMDVLRNLCGHF